MEPQKVSRVEPIQPQQKKGSILQDQINKKADQTAGNLLPHSKEKERDQEKEQVKEEEEEVRPPLVNKWNTPANGAQK